MLLPSVPSPNRDDRPWRSSWHLAPRFRVYAVAAYCLASCAPPAQQVSQPIADADIWWSPELELTSREAAATRLDRAFVPPYDVSAPINGQTHHKSASNCRDFFALLPMGYAPMTLTDDAAYKLDGAKCQAVKALETARPARTGSLAQFALGERTLAVLPPALGPTPSPVALADRQRATQEGRSWSDYDGKLTLDSTDRTHAKVTGEGWTTELELLARADFDGNGTDDVLVLTLAYANGNGSGTEGNWREVKLRILSRSPGVPVLQVVKEMPL